MTHVSFHPVVPLVAASAEDGTVKVGHCSQRAGVKVVSQVWDYESGQFERSLRGHTNAVQHVAFDTAGNMLGDNSQILQ